MRRIGLQLIAEKKAAILAEKPSSGKDTLARKDLQGRDLLTLLLKANMAMDIPEDQRLTDEEVLARESLIMRRLPPLTSLLLEVPTCVYDILLY